MQEERGAEAQVGARSVSDAPQAMSAASTAGFLPVAFLAVVIACVVLPLLETLHPFFGTIVQPVDEHRTANPFPSPGLLLRANGDFADGLNKWFDDHGVAKKQSRTFDMTSIFPRELRLLLERNGFEIEKIFGNYKGESLDADSPRMIAMARKKN